MRKIKVSKPRLLLLNTERQRIHIRSIYSKLCASQIDDLCYRLYQCAVCKSVIENETAMGKSDALVEMGGSWCLVTFATQIKSFKWRLKGKLFWLILLSFFHSFIWLIKTERESNLPNQTGPTGLHQVLQTFPTGYKTRTEQRHNTHSRKHTHTYTFEVQLIGRVTAPVEIVHECCLHIGRAILSENTCCVNAESRSRAASFLL